MELSDNDGTLYQGLLTRNPTLDGSVWYGITSTGIFCRPICTARKPLVQNVRYFSRIQDALSAGFRPCKLCAPLDHPGDIPPAYADLLAEVQTPGAPRLKDQDLRKRGLEPATVRRWFQRRYGMTFQGFTRSYRLSLAFDSIRSGRTVAAAAGEAGYGGPGGLGAAARKTRGSTPKQAAAMTTLAVSRLETPLGTMVAGVWNGSLCLLEFADRRALETEIADLERLLGAKAEPGRTPLHQTVECQLGEYFRRERTTFDLSLTFPGSPFQQSVWSVLLTIPYGATRSYRDQAVALGRPEAIRAIASANGKNRISIVIPCHRVIGADGSLTGYGGGLPRKQALLDLERGQMGFGPP